MLLQGPRNGDNLPFHEEADFPRTPVCNLNRVYVISCKEQTCSFNISPTEKNWNCIMLFLSYVLLKYMG